EAAETALGVLWKTIEDSSGGVDIARCIEAGLEKNIRCAAVARIHGESSQCSALRFLPQTQCLVSASNFYQHSGVTGGELLRPLKIRQRALPFTAPAVNVRAVLSRQSIVGLQLQRPVELR